MSQFANSKQFLTVSFQFLSADGVGALSCAARPLQPLEIWTSSDDNYGELDEDTTRSSPACARKSWLIREMLLGARTSLSVFIVTIKSVSADLNAGAFSVGCAHDSQIVSHSFTGQEDVSAHSTVHVSAARRLVFNCTALNVTFIASGRFSFLLAYYHLSALSLRFSQYIACTV